MTLTKAMRVLGATALTSALMFTAAPVASADQVRDGQWENAYFNLDKVWSVSKGDGIVVAVIDSGVDASHPDIAGSVLPGYDPSGTGKNDRPTDPHGTSMASHIVGHGHGSGAGVVGLAPGAKVLPIYKNDANGSDAVAADIRWAVDHSAKIINISLGSTDAPKSNRALTEAIAYAAQHDVLVVGPAGNSGLGTVESPANEPGVLAVAGTDKNGAPWSGSNYGRQVLLSAPATRIVSAGACAGGQYCIGDGTSDSTAFVSATAALIRSEYPQLTAGQVATRLIKSAKAPAGVQASKLPDPHYGYGILSPYDALTMDIPAGPAQGPFAETAASSSAPPSPAATEGDGTGAGSTGQLPSLAPVPSKTSGSGLGPGMLIAAIGGMLALLVIVIAIVVSKSRRRNGPAPVPVHGQQPPYGAPPNWPAGQQQYEGHAPPPGYPPQQNPYQNPYGPGGSQPPR